MDDIIPVFFCTDNAYAIPTYVALFSLLENLRGDKAVHAYILTSMDFSEDHKRLFQTLVKKYISLKKIEMINMMDSFQNVTIHNNRITTPVFYRLMIPNISKKYGINQCIYLDSDIIVERDISELYQINPDGNYLCGVRDRLLSTGGEKSKSNIVSSENYINCGVLLYNIDAIIKNGIDKKLEITGKKNEYPYDDQDVINLVCFGKIKIIPLKYNIQNFCLYTNGQEIIDQYGIENIHDARKNPVIIHYNIYKKPWSHKYIALGGKWWKYIRMQDKEILQEYIEPFLKEKKTPTNLHEVIMTQLLFSRFFYPAKKVYHDIRKIFRQNPKQYTR